MTPPSRKAATAEQLRSQSQKVLEEFTGGRAGWKMYGEDPKPYAGRVFDYGRHGQAVLSISVFDGFITNSNPFRAEIGLEAAAGCEESVSGKWDDVEKWVLAAECMLSIPQRLRECKNAEEAQRLADEVVPRDLFRICFYLEFEDELATARRRLAQEFGPRARR